MPYNYDPLTATASRLLEKYGQKVALTKTVPGSYDPMTGETTPPTTEAADAFAAILPVGNSVGQQFGDGDMIRQDDRRGIIENAGFEPDEATTLTDVAGNVYSVRIANAIAPSGQAVVYKAILRK